MLVIALLLMYLSIAVLHSEPMLPMPTDHWLSYVHFSVLETYREKLIPCATGAGHKY